MNQIKGIPASKINPRFRLAAIKEINQKNERNNRNINTNPGSDLCNHHDQKSQRLGVNLKGKPTMIDRDEVSEIYEFTRQVEFHGKQVGLIGRLILINADKRNASEKVHRRLMMGLANLCAKQPVSTIAGIKFEIENQP